MAFRKNNLLRFLLLTFAIISFSISYAQDEQKFETDPVILNRIDQWQDLKFGLMMHWGIYAQWGVVESWSICNEPWISRDGVPYTEYKAKYQAQQNLQSDKIRPGILGEAGQRLWHEVLRVHHQASRRLLHV